MDGEKPLSYSSVSKTLICFMKSSVTSSFFLANANADVAKCGICQIFLKKICSSVFDLCMLSSLINKKRSLICEIAASKQAPSDVQVLERQIT